MKPSLKQRGTRVVGLVLSAAIGLLGAIGAANGQDASWLPVRDQNPLVLGSGLPLLPSMPLAAGHWSVEAYLNESNTQLISSEHGSHATPGSTQVVFGAETRESRLSVSYAPGDDWLARASLGDEWIGVGFLDKPIQHFHDLIGAPQGYRGGGLGERPPYIGVTRNGQTLYLLDQPGQAVAPLLLDLTRTWRISEQTRYGLSLGMKLPVGDTARLSDTGDRGVSLSAFADWIVHDWLQLGARVGYLHSSGNDVLAPLARASVPFADVYARAPLFGRWSAQLQYDAHGALYRDVPNFLGDAGQFSFGLVRALGDHGELLLGLSEDLPIAHTQDVSLLVAFRYRPGN